MAEEIIVFWHQAQQSVTCKLQICKVVMDFLIYGIIPASADKIHKNVKWMWNVWNKSIRYTILFLSEKDFWH